MGPSEQRPNAKVLFLSGLQIHPPVAGGNLRSFALVNALRHHGLEVFVYSLAGRKKDYLSGRPSSIQTWPEGAEEFVDRGPLGFLGQYASNVLALPPVWITAYLRAAAASPRERLLPVPLRDKLVWCDAVVADFPFAYPVFLAPSSRGRLRVVSTHNVEHHMYAGWRWWPGRWKRRTVRRIELAAAEACDILVSCSEHDKEFFEKHARIGRSVLVPNGTNVRRFRGIESLRGGARRALGVTDDVRMFLFTASKWGPNHEAFEYLAEFAKNNAELLRREGIHLFVVGNVTAKPLRLPGFTATGRVESVEPYFAAADAALNPVDTGAGTNVKMSEFIAARLPILTTRFGARGFRIEDGRTGFVFDRERLATALSNVRRLFDREPALLRRIAEQAYAQNEDAIDMDLGIRTLVEAVENGRPG